MFNHKLKRNRDPLQINDHERRYIKRSQKNPVYLERSLTLRAPNSPERRNNSWIGQSRINLYWD